MPRAERHHHVGLAIAIGIDLALHPFVPPREGVRPRASIMLVRLSVANFLDRDPRDTRGQS